MYSTLIALHSLTRWLLLAALLYCMYRAWAGWLGRKKWMPADNRWRVITVTLAHIQAALGVWLYLVSPLITYFYAYFSQAVHNRQARFFGMEHSLMMLIAVILITIASSKARRRTADDKKFKALAIWLTIALVVIFINIPWPFSPLTARPWLRFF